MKLIIENLRKTYGKKTIFDNVNFTFEKGKIYGLIGRNGVGKTTLFNSLNEDIEIDKGSFFLECDKITKKLETKDIGYVISTPVVPEFLTAKEFLEVFIQINKENITNLKTVNEYFNMVKINGSDQNKLLKEFSHGSKNKIQMLVNIIKKPKVLLLDEPLTSLDIVVQQEIKELLREIKSDCICIFSTHILELATDLCDEIVIINNENLELISKGKLSKENYKEKIIKVLSESHD